MKKRSLLAITLLSIVTLGLYELYWLVKTRNEMVSKFQAKVPDATYAVVVRALQLIGFFAVVFIIFYALPANNRKVDTALSHKPAAVCYGSYSSNAECKKEVDNYYVTDDSTTLMFAVLAIIAVLGVLDGYYITRWIKPYAIAVEKVTAGRMPASAAIGAYGLISPLFGVLLIQRAFNKT